MDFCLWMLIMRCPWKAIFVVEDGDVCLRFLSNLWLHRALKAPCTSITVICTSFIIQQKFKWFFLWQHYKSIIWAQIVSMSSEEWGFHFPFPLLSCLGNPDPFPAGIWAGKRKGVLSSWELLWHPLPPGKRREEFRQFLAKLFQGQSTYTPPANQGCSWRLYFSIWTSVTFLSLVLYWGLLWI